MTRCAVLAYFTPMSFANVPAMELAEVLAGIAPAGINRFIFECGGSEAVETAMKLAKHYHYYRGDKGRFKIMSRRGAYHGVNGMGLRALGTVMPMRQVMEPLTPGAAFIESPYCYRCPHHLTPQNCDMMCARELARIVEFEGPEQFGVYRRAHSTSLRRIEAARGILAHHSRHLRPLRHSAHHRRGHLRVRPHREDVRDGTLRRQTGHDHHGQGTHQRLCAFGRRGVHRQGDGTHRGLQPPAHLREPPGSLRRRGEKHRDPQTRPPGGKQRGHGGLFPGRAEEPSGASICRRSPRHRPLVGDRS